MDQFSIEHDEKHARGVETWDKLARLYIRMTGERLPDYIDKNSHYYSRLWTLLLNSEIPEQYIQELAQITLPDIRFSNSIIKDLSEFARTKKWTRITIPQKSRLSTAEIIKGKPLPIGFVGDLWEPVDGMNVFEHRPYTLDGKRTPVGLCTDAPFLILYPEKENVDWITLLPGIEIKKGLLLSGVKVLVAGLSKARWNDLKGEKITLSQLNAILKKREEQKRRKR